MAKSKASWGFDISELEPKIRPQDDFYHHVSVKWMRANPIPSTEACWGSFLSLRYDIEKQLRTLVEELAAKKGLQKDSAGRMVADFYRSGMGRDRRNALGLTPLASYLEKMERIRNIADLQKVLAELHSIGVGVLWGADVDQDMKNSDAYALYLGQGGLGMPDREYYLKNDAESTRVRTAYAKHVEKLFTLMGKSLSEARMARETILKIETALAAASMKKEDMRDPDKIYNKLTLAKLQKLASRIDWTLYLKRIRAAKAPYVLVLQPDFFSAVSEMLESIPLEEWKVYLSYHVVNDFSGALSEDFEALAFSFYGKVLTGKKTMKPLWRRSLASVNGGLGEILGKLYVERHFPPEAKKKMNLLVDDLFTAYEARLKSLTWMTPATKKKALLKLKTFTRKIGYPDTWRNYKGLRIEADEYVGNLIRTNEYEHARHMRRLGKPMDRNEWLMYPQTVNAYYQPTMNDIAFPAAILQPPFFSLTNDDALNYGAIGTVIGHEITHGFDDEGSKFDAKGNLKSWWTSEDRKRFMAKASKVEKQFNRYTVADGLHVNGKLTLGENIADLGGLSIAYDAYQLQLARTGRSDIDGLSPEQRFFVGFSLFEREHARPEFTKTQVLTDPHSPGVFRINGPVSNFEPFYKTYGVKKGDEHFRTPGDREMVW
ncbi:MAG TPA: M13 family metallopeptidase [Candidatus Paceibacterota bacterium]|nr:M13 family metallopeptidase [Candidatus Paceibacterota bacterium]